MTTCHSDMTTLHDGLLEGIQRADYGIATVSRHYPEWLAKARKHAVEIAQAEGRVSSDDIHEICPMPEGAHPNLMGAVFRNINLYLAGYKRSTRPSAHGRVIRVYKWK